MADTRFRMVGTVHGVESCPGVWQVVQGSEFERGPDTVVQGKPIGYRVVVVKLVCSAQANHTTADFYYPDLFPAT
ncbi:hypothetical protein CA850_29610 [Micromonospora echinospora]|uniref:Uncharacterized protein n=1 Tax=Micromonospora echinospora TaxID=1877 RepID=A0A1C4U4N6_MICEC|nr:hypothetical protein [Micromonospora echinospora]OZV74737.1 hypothetical protein CA850_29610 [Micromonospora echinospora]SCE66631.1 hypothetical protein GA0070618_0011 [Micromonospora echinospora]